MDERTDERTDGSTFDDKSTSSTRLCDAGCGVVPLQGLCRKRVSMLDELGIIRGEPELTRRWVTNGVPRKWVP